MNFVVDPAGLRTGGEAVDRLRAAAVDDLRRMHDRTRGRGPGQGVYEELTAVAADALALVDAALAHSAAGTQAMAADYQRVDHAARDDLVRAAGLS